MAKRTEVELARAELLDTIRTVARLKSRFELRRTLNDIEAMALEQFEDQVVLGSTFQIDAAALFEEL